MASSLALKDATAARGAGDSFSGAEFTPGRTVIMYVGGQYAGVAAVGSHDTVARAAIAGILDMPDSSHISAGAKTVTAKDATDGSSATTTVTLT